jgi:hypothetical protein
MHKFVRSLITEWRKLGLPVEGETIVVAVSGGADSMSLLLAIDELRRRKKLQLDVVVAHLNTSCAIARAMRMKSSWPTFAKTRGFAFVSCLGEAQANRQPRAERS